MFFSSRKLQILIVIDVEINCVNVTNSRSFVEFVSFLRFERFGNVPNVQRDTCAFFDIFFKIISSVGVDKL